MHHQYAGEEEEGSHQAAGTDPAADLVELVQEVAHKVLAAEEATQVKSGAASAHVAEVVYPWVPWLQGLALVWLQVQWPIDNREDRRQCIPHKEETCHRTHMVQE